MTKKSKILTVIGVIVGLVIIGLGIYGYSAGWFAGLADRISGQAKATIVVKKMIDPSGMPEENNLEPMSGVAIYVNQEPFARQTDSCQENANGEKSDPPQPTPVEGALKGKTGADGSREISLTPPDQGTSYYFRVARTDAFPRLQSCAFALHPSHSSNAYFNDHVYLAENVWPGANLGPITFIYVDLIGGGGGGGGDEPEPDKGTITGTVKGRDVAGRLVPVQGATVFVPQMGIAAGGQTRTKSSGQFFIYNVPPRDNYYTLEISKNCYYDKRISDRPMTVRANETTNVGIVELQGDGVPTGKSKIKGEVSEVGNPNKKISGASVELTIGGNVVDGNLTGSNPATTDENGYFQFCPIAENGFYVLTVEANNYEPKVVTEVATTVGATTTKNIQLSPTGQTDEESFTITGQVVEVITGANSPVVGATVTVVDRENNLEPVMKTSGGVAKATTKSTPTYERGYFTIEDIPIPENRNYALFATKDGYEDGYLLLDWFDPAPTRYNLDNASPPRKIYLTKTGITTLITGKVTIEGTGTPVDGAAVWIEKVIGGESKRIATTNNNGVYDTSNPINPTQPSLDTSYIGIPVKIKAVYHDGLQEQVGYYKERGSEVVYLPPTRHGVDIQVGQSRVIEVSVLEDGKGVNGADVVLEELQDGTWTKMLGSEKKTSTINGVEGRVDYAAPGTTNMRYRFSASRRGGGSGESKEFNSDNPPRAITVHLEGGARDPNTVTYKFYFFEKPDRDVLDPSNWKELLRGITNPFGAIADEILDQFLEENDAFADAIHFIKQNRTFSLRDGTRINFTKALWAITPKWTQPAGLGITNVEWDERLRGADGNHPAGHENDTNEYIVRITFESKEKRDEFFSSGAYKTAFCRQPNQVVFQVDTDGNKGDIGYDKDPAKIVCKNVILGTGSAPDDESGGIVRVGVIFRFNIKRGEIKRAIMEIFKPTIQRSVPGFGRVDDIFVNPRSAVARLIRISGGTSSREMGAQPSVAGAQTTIGDYKIVNGVAYIPNPGPGNYRTQVVGSTKYKIDNRSNTFTVGEEDELVIVEPRLCYKAGGIIERTSGGINYKYFGYLEKGYDLFPSGSNLSKSVLDKAGVREVIYVGDALNPPKYSVFSTSDGFSYCTKSGGTVQDQEISQESVVVSSSFLKDVKNSYPIRKRQSIVASKISQEASLLIYEDLSRLKKRSWRRIVNAANSFRDPEPIYKTIISESGIENYISRDDIYQDPEQLYSLVASLYKQKGAILEQRISQMDNQKQKQNVMKAMTRFVIETVGPNGSVDLKLYKPAGRILSQTMYSANMIKSGNWLQENYRNLGIRQKINVRYYQFLSSVWGNKATRYVNRQIQAFNDWIDRLRGIGDTGTVEGTVLKAGEPQKDALVTIGDKVGKTNNRGEFTIRRIPVGRHKINVRNRKTSAVLELANPGLQVTARKNQVSTKIIRLKTD